MNVVVDERGQQIVRSANGMKVTSEMKIDIFHRHNLGIAAASSTAFHPKAGSKAGLAQANDCLLADPIESITESNGGCGFALAGWRG
jgi:hypothetical protein